MPVGENGVSAPSSNLIDFVVCTHAPPSPLMLWTTATDHRLLLTTIVSVVGWLPGETLAIFVFDVFIAHCALHPQTGGQLKAYRGDRRGHQITALKNHERSSYFDMIFIRFSAALLICDQRRVGLK